MFKNLTAHCIHAHTTAAGLGRTHGAEPGKPFAPPAHFSPNQRASYAHAFDAAIDANMSCVPS